MTPSKSSLVVYKLESVQLPELGQNPPTFELGSENVTARAQKVRVWVINFQDVCIEIMDSLE